MFGFSFDLSGTCISAIYVSISTPPVSFFSHDRSRVVFIYIYGCAHREVNRRGYFNGGIVLIEDPSFCRFLRRGIMRGSRTDPVDINSDGSTDSSSDEHSNSSSDGCADSSSDEGMRMSSDEVMYISSDEGRHISSDEGGDTSSDESVYTSSDEGVYTSSDEDSYRSFDGGAHTTSSKGTFSHVHLSILEFHCMYLEPQILELKAFTFKGGGRT